MLALALSGCSGGGSASSALPATRGAAPAADVTGPGATPAVGAAGIAAAAAPTGAPILKRSAQAVGVAAPIATGGAVLGADDFSADTAGSPPGGWTTLAGQPVVCTGPQGTRQLCLPAGSANASVAGSGGWTNYHVDSTVTISGTPAGGGASLLGRIQPNGNFYEFEVRPDVNGSGQWFWYIWNFNGQWTLLGGQALASPPGSTFAMRFDLNGSQLSGYIGASAASLVPLGSITDQSYVAGGVGVRNFGATAADFGAVTVTSDGGAASGTTASAPPTTMNPQPGSAAPSSLPTEVPRSAGAFIAGTGINMHTGSFGGPYTANMPLMDSLVTGLGIKLIRDGMSPYQPTICAENARYGAAGIKLNVVMDPIYTTADLQRWSACVGAGVIGSVEGWNEYDLTHPASDTNWPATLQNAQRSIYGTVKSQLGGVAVLGPALTTGAAASAVGDLSAVEDFGNAHAYYNGHFPENGGYGSNNYGSIAAILGFSATTSASRQMTVTETGYGTAGGSGNVSENVQAKYILRDMLSLQNAGAAKVFWYELIDEGTPPFGGFGLLRSDLSPKPSYTALKSLLSVLADPSTSSPAAPLAYTLGGSTANVEHALFQKSDGTYALALWLGVASSNPNTGADLAVNPQSLTVTLSRSFTATLQTINANGNLQAQVLPTGTSVAFPVTDQVQVLTFK